MGSLEKIEKKNYLSIYLVKTKKLFFLFLSDQFYFENMNSYGPSFLLFHIIINPYSEQVC